MTVPTWTIFTAALKQEDIYFVSNKKMQWAEAECEFRVKNKIPELWIPETGEDT